MAKKLKIEKGKKRDKWNLVPKSDLIYNALLSETHIEILGNSKLEIDGCEGVYEYSSEYLKLRLKEGALLICGSDFDILTFENKTMTMRGKIKSIEFGV